MANYKTPGVYIEEISKFPPSVAQVETAIPAFIGYTEKAARRNGDSLNLDPLRISSLLEYETYFGQAKSETIKVEIDDTTDDDGEVTNRSIKVHQPDPLVKSPFLMYYSMQMYFANGGGPCYIISVGEYGDDAVSQKTLVNKDELDSGLAAVRKEDEPTLLLFPDATNLPGSQAVENFYALYNSALMQCTDLQDRFTIIDLQSDDDSADPSPEDTFRNKISNNQINLKYGAAYYPYLQTILNYQFDEETVELSHTTTSPNAVPYALGVLKAIENTGGALPVTISRNLGDLVQGIRNEPIDAGATTGGSLAVLEKFMIETFDIHGVTPPPVNPGDPETGPKEQTTANRDLMLPILVKAIDDLKELVDLKEHIVDHAESVIASITENAGQKGAVQTALDNFVNAFNGTTSDIELVHDALIPLHEKLVSDTTNVKVKNTTTSIHAEVEKLLSITGSTETATAFAYSVDVFTGLAALLTAIVAAITTADTEGTDKDNGSMNGRTLDQISALDNAVYNTIKVEIDALPLTLPPSSAIAGVYARIDATRGVWKAPANTSLNYVIKPTLQISHEEQGTLNVHTTGKSINAIRTFTGKGTLVWGARTLAGNDNEWRYINVRRFFNMVEESVGKATEQFVFEGNDANTWVRVRAMIENFLILQWKAGALAGAKAEQAFYVRVGLGQTMTAQDILEGRMIIEIGMAAVRPAEFIILRFSHKMQEA